MRAVAWFVGLLFAIVTMLERFTVVARVTGRSMEPTLHDGDVVIGVRGLPRVLSVRRGAVVLVRVPSHGGRLEVKRVGAVAGDRRIWLAAGKPSLIPSNHIFLESDGAPANAAALAVAADSRTYGPVPAAAVVARVVAVKKDVDVRVRSSREGNSGRTARAAGAMKRHHGLTSLRGRWLH